MKYLGCIKHVSGYVAILNCLRLRELHFLAHLNSIRGDSLLQLGYNHWYYMSLSFTLQVFIFIFRETYYGLAIVGNQNLRSIPWQKMDDLFLYGRIDVRIAVYNNSLLPQDSIAKLEKLFPYSVDQWDNTNCKYFID